MIPWIGGTKLTKDSWALMNNSDAASADQLNNMAFILDLLRPGDVFVNVGVNVGAYSILASGVRSAYTYGIESDPTAFEHLQANIQLNHLEKMVTAINLAPNTPNDELHVATAQNDQFHQTLDTNPAPLNTLDKLIRRMPDLIKIDAHAIEMGILQGGLQLLMAPYLKAIILEQKGFAKGVTQQNLHQQLLELQFGAYIYEPEQRNLEEVNPAETYPTIVYCRDLEWVKMRVSIADKVKAFPHRLKERTSPTLNQ